MDENEGQSLSSTCGSNELTPSVLVDNVENDFNKIDDKDDQNKKKERIKILEEKLQLALEALREKDILIKELQDNNQKLVDTLNRITDSSVQSCSSSSLATQDNPWEEIIQIENPFQWEMTNQNTINSNNNREAEGQELISDNNNNSANDVDEETRAFYILSHKVLENSLLLKTILDKLDSKQLLSLRLVSKLWADVGSSVTNNREYIYISFRYDVDTKSFHKESKRIHLRPHDNTAGNTTNSSPKSNSQSPLQLAFLTKCIKSSTNKKFPCAYFCFRNISDIGSSDLKKFMKLYGERIKRLNLTFFDSGSNQWTSKIWRRLRIMLLVQCKNTNRLDLHFSQRVGSNNDNNFSTDLLFPDPGSCLPNLQFLHLQGYFTAIGEILRASPHLETFSGFSPNLVDVFISTGKIHTVKYLFYSPSSTDLPLYKKFANTQPKLKMINLTTQGRNVDNDPRFYRQATKVLSLILEASKDSLEEMDLKICHTDKLCDFVWPVLNKLKKLTLDEDNDETWRADDDVDIADIDNISVFDFPPGFSSHVFPNLEYLRIFPDIEESSLIESFLDKIDKPLLKMKKFYFSQSLPLFFAKKISTVFPNLENLQTLLLEDFMGDWGKYIWSCDKLKKIDLNFDTRNDEFCKKSFPQLDSCFTGLSKNLCRRLQKRNFARKMIKKWASNNYADVPRINPSIVNCKDLKNIHIRFMSSLDSLPSSYRFFTAVTGELAFHFLPELKITLTAGALGDPNHFKCWKKIVEAAVEPMVPFCEEIILQEKP